MKPKWYFIVGSIVMFAGLVFSILSAVFFISVMSFVLRSHGPMGQYRLEAMLSSFPIWAPVCAIAGVLMGFWFLKQYDFSYKKYFIPIVISLVSAVIVTGIAIDYFRWNDQWFNRGPMQGIMRKYKSESTTHPRFGKMKQLQQSP